ncbi:MAG: formylglycine-generating enzyme family protein [Alphaproteobacteria bacterium]|nr:formylglycine-generating enzyme family protein [Alphaproteobacteria bacterium]
MPGDGGCASRYVQYGAPESETDRHSSEERPVHRVTVGQPFAIGKYEVTFAEWDACVADGGCNGYRPDDRGWGRGKRPVINVNYQDAKAYTAWLSRETGHAYRLPSEAEWEYAARAGTTTRYHFGDSIRTSQANYSFSGETVRVGSFSPNLFGLHDVHGNVYEWVEDCWNESYAGAPSDTDVWTTGDCYYRILRGGSWIVAPRYVRSASRNKYAPGVRYNDYGFRVARSLP